MVDKVLGLIVVLHLAVPTGLYLYLQSTVTQIALIPCILLAVLAFITAYILIPTVGPMNSAAGLTGKDLNKKDRPVIPESLGIVAGTVFLVFVILQQVFQNFRMHTENLPEYNAALTSICFMLFLGFSDDVLNLRWRYKLILPAVATLPLLVAYAGGTAVVVPIQLTGILGDVLELGVLYHGYLLFVAIFCTNSINILAGVNGLEAGQSFAIACAVISHNLVEIYLHVTPTTAAHHTFSLWFMLPFIAVTGALWSFNWFPAKVFVGDTYTYFAGMCFAVASILGHFSKTLLLFFIPQIINFIYSVPQLFHFMPCPRHRMPKYNDKTDKVGNSFMATEGKYATTTNFTLLNLVLTYFGPMSERKLCIIMIIIQDVSLFLCYFRICFLLRLIYFYCIWIRCEILCCSLFL